jgi:hypothetical protein
MRRTRLMLGVLAAVACAEPTGPSAQPFAVQWVEWPAAVTAQKPGAVLVTYVDDFCSTLDLGVAADFPNVTVRSLTTRTNAPCPLASPIALILRDTLLPLPVLAAPYSVPVYYSMQATLSDAGFGDPTVRFLGPIQLAAVPDTTRYMAGTGTMLVDSLGCTILAPGFGLSRTYAALNPPALGGQARRALVGAHVVSGPIPSGCAGHRMVQLDYATVALIP